MRRVEVRIGEVPQECRISFGLAARMSEPFSWVMPSRDAAGRQAPPPPPELTLAVMCSFLGQAWCGPKAWPSLRECGLDVIEHGEGVFDALIEDGIDAGAATKAAMQLYVATMEAMPAPQAEVDEAADFSEAQQAPSTAA